MYVCNMQTTAQPPLAERPLPSRCDLLLVAVDAQAPLKLDAAALSAAATQRVARVAKAEQFAGRTDETLSVWVPRDDGAELQLVLLGCGDNLAKPTGERTVRLGARAVRAAMARGAKEPVLVVPVAESGSDGADKAALQQAVWLAQGAYLGAYQNVAHKSAPEATAKARPRPPERLGITLPRGPAVAQALTVGQTLAESVNLARELVNMPPNELGPPEFAERARALSKVNGVRCKVLHGKALEDEGLNLLRAVGVGSVRGPQLVHLAYEGEGAGTGAPVVLIGKGITFDSGGLCIKPCESMSTMKMDMGGAAAVLSTVVAAARLGLPVRLHAVLALAENMPAGNATRPGDIVTSAAGKTVEINNTDAEGRLVLADAITWARRHLEPGTLVDVATLTGACMVALGPKTAGLFSSKDALADALREAAGDAGEDFWRMPLTPGLRDQLKSDVADMRNTGERLGGAITAALFLRDFVGDVPWAHLDIAGPAWANDEGPHHRRGGTGFACATLTRWLMRLASQESGGGGGGRGRGRGAGRPAAATADPAKVADGDDAPETPRRGPRSRPATGATATRRRPRRR